jgi:hypothetical protein
MAGFGYTQFHVKLALHGLHQFALSLKSSLEVVLLAAGQVVLMALALLAWPLWMNALWLAEHWAWYKVAAVLVGYSAALTLPILLLRKRLLPNDVLLWGRTLPVTPGARVRAYMAVTGVFVLPTAIGFGLSSIGCWYEIPAVRSVWPVAVLMMLIALVLMQGLGTGVLMLRHRGLTWQRLIRLPMPMSGPVVPYQAKKLSPHLLQQWYRLFWLPFWRLENGIGFQQCLLFCVAGLMFWLWMLPGSAFLRFLFCISASSLTLILTDRGDKAVQEQIILMRPHLRTLPFSLFRLELLAKLACMVPACGLLAGLAWGLFSRAAVLHPGVAYWYLGTQLLAQVCIVGLGHLHAAGRARIVILFMVVLAAIGSELWK